MDQVLDILKKLGIDHSFYFQLGIIVAVLLVARFVLLNSLLKVILFREEKTIKLDQIANKLLAKADHVHALYNKEIEEHCKQVKKIAYEKKREIVQEEKGKIKKTEELLKQKMDLERGKIQSSMELQRAQNQKETDSLMNSFLDKICS